MKTRQQRRRFRPVFDQLFGAGRGQAFAQFVLKLAVMDMAADQQLNSSLGCQAVITRPGNYVVEIPKWNRNYTSEGKPLTLAEGK